MAIDAIAGGALPHFNKDDAASPEKLVAKLNELTRAVENRLERLARPLVDPRDPAAGEEVYDFANVTEDRTLDADSTSVGEIADVLGTLIQDLYNEGRIR